LANYSNLCVVVDAVPQTAGMGIVIFDGTTRQTLRRPTAGSTSYVVFQIGGGLISRPAAGPQQSQSNVRFWRELWGMGISCTGAVVSGVGVVGAVGLAPETGGMSLSAVVLLWGGATASAAQCGVGVYRMANVARGRDDINDAMDQSTAYKSTMYVLDGVGLVGAGGAFKEIAETNVALREAGASWDVAKAAQLSRQQRATFTGAIGVDTVKRLANPMISRVVKQRLLDLAGAALGMVGSSTADGGIINDIAVWIVTQPVSRP